MQFLSLAPVARCVFHIRAELAGAVAHVQLNAQQQQAFTQVPIYHQRLAQSEGWPVVWDYHVLAVVLPELQPQALDFDTTLPFKTPLREYVERAVQPLNPALSFYPRWFRFVPGDALLRHFASDRRHMLSTHAAAAPEDDPSASMYKMPPPPQPCISNAEGCCNNLDRYLDMLLDRAADCERMRMTWKKLDSLSSSPYGVVLSESQLCQLTL